MSSKEQRIVEEIKKNYSEQSEKESQFDELCKLDERVKRPAEVCAFTLGTIGALVLGTGMCFAMQVLTTASFAMPLGIVVGVLGIVIVSVNYFIYKAILKHRKRKYADKIIELSDKILNN
ncbi:MAG: dihydropteridine reductase [Candidatus Coproplasma sp.]